MAFDFIALNRQNSVLNIKVLHWKRGKTNH